MELTISILSITVVFLSMLFVIIRLMWVNAKLKRIIMEQAQHIENVWLEKP